MTLTNRERYIVLFLHYLNTNVDNKLALHKMKCFSDILALDLTEIETMEIMHEIDEMMLDLIDLEAHNLKLLMKQQGDLKK